MDQEIDEHTETIFLQLLLDDVNDNIKRFKTQQSLGHTNPPIGRVEEAEFDRGVALQAWKSEIERHRVMLSDFQMATELSQGNEAEEIPLSEKKRKHPNWIFIAIQKLVTSSKNALCSIKLFSSADSKPGTCTCCEKVRSEIFKTQCSHSYCKACLIYMVMQSLQNESFFPAQCCRKPIVGSGVKRMIGAALAEKQKEKTIEMSDHNRTYCSDPNCAQYIMPRSSFWSKLTRSTIRTCKCGIRTCIKCKSGAHRDWCLYRLDDSLEELMKRMSWQRCFKCGHVIERNEGCLHIT